MFESVRKKDSQDISTFMMNMNLLHTQNKISTVSHQQDYIPPENQRSFSKSKKSDDRSFGMIRTTVSSGREGRPAVLSHICVRRIN